MRIDRFKKDVLYHPIDVFSNGDRTVEVLSTRHFADSSYYDTLQERIDQYTLGFFEGLTTPVFHEDLPPEKVELMEKLAGALQRYRLMMTACGWSRQMESLSHAPSWVNADVSSEEFALEIPLSELEALVGQYLLVPHMEKAVEEDLDAVIDSVKHELKNWYTRPLHQKVIRHIRNLVGDFLNPSYRYVVDARNYRLCQFISSELESPTEKDFIIEYGAGHLRGIAEFLSENDFKHKKRTWIPCIDLSTQIRQDIANLRMNLHAESWQY